MRIFAAAKADLTQRRHSDPRSAGGRPAIMTELLIHRAAMPLCVHPGAMKRIRRAHPAATTPIWTGDTATTVVSQTATPLPSPSSPTSYPATAAPAGRGQPLRARWAGPVSSAGLERLTERTDEPRIQQQPDGVMPKPGRTGFSDDAAPLRCGEMMSAAPGDRLWRAWPCDRRGSSPGRPGSRRRCLCRIG